MAFVSLVTGGIGSKLFKGVAAASKIKGVGGLIKRISGKAGNSVYEIDRALRNAEEVLRSTDEVKHLIGEKLLDNIVKKGRGNRPDPETYLPRAYIEGHLAKFDEGASYQVPTDVLDEFGRDVLGDPRDVGVFVTSSKDMDRILAETGGDISLIEEALGITPGSWRFNQIGQPRTLTRINIADPRALKLRMATGNELKANARWLPGGMTSGGRIEAIIDRIPKGKYTEHLVSN